MKVGTHDGVFHADDVFSIALLRRLYDEVIVMRSRDPKALEWCEMLVDVGGEYSPKKQIFDHHQRGGAGRRENGIPYASFGLLWRHKGVEACGGSPYVAEKVDRNLVQPIDATDCGFELHTGWVVEKTRDYSINAVIKSMNPTWDEFAPPDRGFDRAVDVASLILDNEIKRARGRIKAENIVRGELAHMSSDILVLGISCPWIKVVVEEAPNIKFVVYPNDAGNWMVQAVPKALGSRDNKKDLPESWAGLRGEEFRNVCGIESALFCHSGRFICGAEMRYDALELARLALEA